MLFPLCMLRIVLAPNITFIKSGWPKEAQAQWQICLNRLTSWPRMHVQVRIMNLQRNASRPLSMKGRVRALEILDKRAPLARPLYLSHLHF